MSSNPTINLENPPKKLDVEEVAKSLQHFEFIDYSMFALMLIICSGIGIYFGYKDHKLHQMQKRSRLRVRRGSEALEYLVGSRNLQVFPVSMSLVASYVSGITLLGMSTEIYYYGAQFFQILIAAVLMSIYLYYVIIPVFHDLKITSTYEYLEARFDKKVRSLCSVMFAVAAVLWMPIVIYVPALAFNQVTGINIHIITPITCLVCIFYTLLGGIKAVIWTDVIQIVNMYGILILIFIKGTWNIGGFDVIIERNLASGRIESPDFSFDPTIRHSFWSLLVGGTIFWINTNGCNQSMVQRFLSLKDVRTARKGLIIYVIGISIMMALCMYNGLLIFAKYHDCDPLESGLVKAKDQLLPLLVVDLLRELPGVPGLFIAGVFSAALSSLSTGLNSMSAVILEDFFKSFSKRTITERETAIIMRASVFILGSIAVGLVYVVQHMGSVLQLSMTVPAACLGPMLGVFFIGMFMPFIDAKGAFYGTIASLIGVGYVVFKSQADMTIGVYEYDTKPVSVEGCNYTFIPKMSVPRNETYAEMDKSLHHLSYLYYTTFATIITCTVAIIYNWFAGFQDPTLVDPRLLAPVLRKYIKSKPVEIELEEKEEYSTAYEFEEQDNQLSEK